MEGQRSEIVFIHRIEGNHCRAMVAGRETHFDVYATVYDPRPNSPELRDQVKAILESASGASDFDIRNLRFSLGGFVPRRFADEDRIIVTPSGMSDDIEMKARVRIVFDISKHSRHDLDPFFEFETNLENHLEAVKAGFVDGNEIGLGEYAIYCFGKSKAELLEAIEEFCTKCAPGAYTLG